VATDADKNGLANSATTEFQVAMMGVFNMRNHIPGRGVFVAAAVLCLSPCLGAQAAPQQGKEMAQSTKSAQAVDPRDLSGVWMGNYNESIIPNELLTPWALEKFNAQRTERAVGNRPIIYDGEKNSTDPIVKGCDPPGVPRVYFHARPFEIMKVSGRFIFHYEEYDTFREIWTDGREVPKDPDPSWNGYSVGRWQGDILVVDTIGFNGKTWIDNAGHSVTESMHLTERFKRIDHDHMAIDFTFDDPKSLTQPFTYKRVYTLHPDWEITEYICTDEDKENFYKGIMAPAGKP
jgi:hypothetical protein